MKRRGKEEALKNILDVQGDDVMENIRVYQRLHGDDPAIVKLYKPDTVCYIVATHVHVHIHIVQNRIFSLLMIVLQSYHQ